LSVHPVNGASGIANGMLNLRRLASVLVAEKLDEH
jgi:hypothetical protein